MLAYDYPLLGVFWTLLMFSLFALVLASVVWAMFDNFRRRDHSGWAKAGWFVFILLFPILGVFVYLVVTTPAGVPARETP
jgi:predicted PurR-regulated permease PerM